MPSGQVFCRVRTQLPESLVSTLTEPGLIVSMAVPHAANTHHVNRGI
jgi:hypothetical protein